MVEIKKERIANAQPNLLEYVQKEFRDRVWGAVEHILRNHIDNPIEGELTREKVKAAGIRSVFFSEEPLDMKVEKHDEKGVSLRIQTNLIGVAQGHYMIHYDGWRRPLTEEEESSLSADECGIHFMPESM